jgi:hypothetical protein
MQGADRLPAGAAHIEFPYHLFPRPPARHQIGWLPPSSHGRPAAKRNAAEECVTTFRENQL